MNEIGYNEQSAYQGEPVKPQIDMLPCRTSSNPWFYAMIVCFFVDYIFTKIILHQLHKTESYSFSNIDGISAIDNIDTFLSPLLAIPGIVFALLFANGCKKLIHNEYNFAITFVCLNIAAEVIYFIGNVTEMNPTITLSIIALLGIAALVMIVLLVRSFINNYSGELNELGIDLRKVLKLTFISLGILILGFVLFLLTESRALLMTFYIVVVCLGLYTLYLAYLALRKMNWILEAGHHAQFTNYDMECYLNGYSPNRSNSNSSQFKVPSNKDKNKSKDSKNLSASSKIIIGIFSVAALATLAYVITNHSKETTNDYPEQTIIDEDYEEGNIYSNEEEDIPSSIDEEYTVVDQAKPEEVSIPDWIPEIIRGSLVDENYFLLEENIGENLMSLGTYNGRINSTSIIMKLNFNNDGSVEGKYAYQSTLRKYGDNSSSWYRLNGVALSSKEGDPKIVLRSYAPDTGKLFEYFYLENIHYGEIDGKMFNVRYLTNPTSKLYDVYLKQE